MLHSNTISNFSKTSEGGFDKDGQISGPYINISYEGDIAYEIDVAGQRSGPYVIVANDRYSAALTEFKDGKEIDILTFYAPKSLDPMLSPQTSLKRSLLILINSKL